MWELLLQLRVLLPYLARLAPLLERGLVRQAPELSGLNKEIAEIHSGRRDLEAQVRNQGVQLGRLEQQIARLRVVHESSVEDMRVLTSEVQLLHRWVMNGAIVGILLLVAAVGMLVFLVIRP